MSNLSAEQSSTPAPRPRQSNEVVSDSGAAKKKSGHGGVAALHEAATTDDCKPGRQSALEQPSSISAAHHGAHEEMSYPVDENLFHSAPSQPPVDPEVAATEAETYQEPAAEELLPPPDFTPFFTLIEDPDTGEHYHPTVHYVFADDDTDLLTSATLEALDNHAEASTHPEEAEDRFVVVDMAIDGRTVASTSSLSSDWQAVKTTVTQAPSWGDESRSADKGLMLKISGQEGTSSGTLEHGKRRRQQAGSIDDMVAAFSERLRDLDEVLGRTTSYVDPEETK